MRVVIIGGSDAGISAGLRAKELAPDTEVVLLTADHYPNYSICGLPFYVSGETPRWQALAHRTGEDLAAAGLDVRTGTRVGAIDVSGHFVRLADGTRIDYDRLVVGTGARSIVPPIPGLDLPGVTTMHWVDEARDLVAVLESKDGGRAVVVGGGYIGLEMADALRHRGLDVELVEMATEVLTTVDAEFGALIRATLERHGVVVRTETTVSAILARGSALEVESTRERTTADVVVVAVGVRPNTALLEAAGCELGASGAVVVDDTMATGLTDVWAAGDCVHTHHRLLREPTYLPLGTTAHKQGRIAGENAVGGDVRFAGSLGSQAVKVFDRVVARTGLRDDEAATAGYIPRTADVTIDDHKAYYPGATGIRLRITGDVDTGRLLGAQALGAHRAEVSKRVDVLASAIHHGASVYDVSRLDLTYTPPLSSPWDPVQLACQAWESEFGRPETPGRLPT